jgi:hypothetical protein
MKKLILNPLYAEGNLFSRLLGNEVVMIGGLLIAIIVACRVGLF